MTTWTNGFWSRKPGVLILAIGTLTTALVLLAPGAGAGGGDCISVHVDSPIQLPDGSVHRSGRLTLCNTRVYSPVASLHKTFVNGLPVGMLLSRKRTSEAGSDLAPTILFHRAERGNLELVGYVLPGNDASVTYSFGAERRRIRKHHQDLASAATAPGADRQDSSGSGSRVVLTALLPQ